MWFDTSAVYLTSSSATGDYPLTAFDGALRNACIADFNLIRVTSIVPSGTPIRRLVSQKQISGNGLLIPAVYESIRSDKIGTVISVAVGVGVAEQSPGLIFSYRCDDTESKARSALKEMIRESMAKKGISDFKLKIASASAKVVQPWTCVFAAAVFCDSQLEEVLHS